MDNILTADRFATLRSDLTVLRDWAPLILQQGSAANPLDLMEIIRIRARLNDAVPAAINAGHAEPFVQLTRADRLCAPYCGTLLYLPQEDAERSAEEGGSFLNPFSWFGVHVWDLARVALTDWTRQISDAQGEVHRAEVLRAFLAFEETHTQESMNTWFTTPEGRWVAYLDIEHQAEMFDLIERERARTT